MSTAAELAASLRCVCVWFGEHKIVEHLAEPALAARFEDAMRRRFAGLRVTNEPATRRDVEAS
jgi:hypothetical protein